MIVAKHGVVRKRLVLNGRRWLVGGDHTSAATVLTDRRPRRRSYALLGRFARSPSSLSRTALAPIRLISVVSASALMHPSGSSMRPTAGRARTQNFAPSSFAAAVYSNCPCSHSSSSMVQTDLLSNAGSASAETHTGSHRV